MLPIAPKEYFDARKRFETYLPMGQDRELLILKGHLLIERMLETYLSQNLANPQELAESRLRFGQKLSLVAALHKQPGSAWLWAVLRRLNGLRNELAHKIESAKFDALLEQFITEVEASPELRYVDTPPNEERLRYALFVVHEAMSLRVNL